MYLSALNVKINNHSDVNVPSPFIFKKLASRNPDKISYLDLKKDLEKEVRNFLKKEKEEIEQQLKSFDEGTVDKILRLLTPNHRIGFSHRRKSAEAFVFNSNKLGGNIFILYQNNSQRKKIIEREGREKEFIITKSSSREKSENRTYIVICSSKDDFQKFHSFFNEQVDKIADILDFAMKLEIEEGEELLNKILSEKERIKNWELRETDNEFENKVQTFINSHLGCVVNNLEVTFNSGTNSEYDVFAVPLSRYGEQFVVEVKNFEKIKDEIENNTSEIDTQNLKSKLITGPKDLAGILGAQLIMIVKGIAEEPYNDLKGLAQEREILFLNENNFQEKIREKLITDVF